MKEGTKKGLVAAGILAAGLEGAHVNSKLDDIAQAADKTHQLAEETHDIAGAPEAEQSDYRFLLGVLQRIQDTDNNDHYSHKKSVDAQGSAFVILEYKDGLTATLGRISKWPSLFYGADFAKRSVIQKDNLQKLTAGVVKELSHRLQEVQDSWFPGGFPNHAKDIADLSKLTASVDRQLSEK